MFVIRTGCHRGRVLSPVFGDKSICVDHSDDSFHCNVQNVIANIIYDQMSDVWFLWPIDKLLSRKDQTVAADGLVVNRKMQYAQSLRATYLCTMRSPFCGHGRQCRTRQEAAQVWHRCPEEPGLRSAEGTSCWCWLGRRT